MVWGGWNRGGGSGVERSEEAGERVGEVYLCGGKI